METKNKIFAGVVGTLVILILAMVIIPSDPTASAYDDTDETDNSSSTNVDKEDSDGESDDSEENVQEIDDNTVAIPDPETGETIYLTIDSEDEENAKESMGNKENATTETEKVTDVEDDIVIDIDEDAPILKLSTNEVNTLVGYDFVLEHNPVAYDEVDGDLTDKIEVEGTYNIDKVGTYVLTYSVEDESGNVATDTMTVNVYDEDEEFDTVNPVITLSDSEIDMLVGTDFDSNDYLISATDTNSVNDEVLNLRFKVQTVGTVKTDEVGTYVLTYSVLDNFGNEGIAELTVNVKPNTLTPEIDVDRPDIEGMTPEIDVEGGHDLTDVTPITPEIDEIDRPDLGDFTGITPEVDPVDPEDGHDLTEITPITPEIDGIDRPDLGDFTGITPEVDPIGPINPDNGHDLTEVTPITPEIDAIDRPDSGDFTGITPEVDVDRPDIEGITPEVDGSDEDAPVITLSESNVTVEFGGSFDANSYLVSAEDAFEGDLTSSVVVSSDVNTSVAGSYTVTYTVSDSSGNEATETLTVTVEGEVIIDTEAPVITLNQTSVTVAYGGVFNAQDYISTATDNIDGNVRDKVTIDSPVNTTAPGTYTVTYSVTDSAENKSTATLTVTVEEDINTGEISGYVLVDSDANGNYYTRNDSDMMSYQATFANLVNEINPNAYVDNYNFYTTQNLGIAKNVGLENSCRGIFHYGGSNDINVGCISSSNGTSGSSSATSMYNSYYASETHKANMENFDYYFFSEILVDSDKDGNIDFSVNAMSAN